MTTAETLQWKAEINRSPLGDTGDYMSTVSLTNGTIRFDADDVTDFNEVVEIAQLLNKTSLLEKLVALQEERAKLLSGVINLYAGSRSNDETFPMQVAYVSKQITDLTQQISHIREEGKI